MTNPRTSAVLHFTLATAGHVDHGKTSLLRALTGIDPDRLKEEKEREMTTDIGFAHLRLSLEQLEERSDKFVDLYRKFLAGDRVRHDENSPANQIATDSELVIGFVDVPGHGKFLKNMLAGVGGIDMALLVIALDEGVMPQTVQHVKILSLLGVRSCILVFTKSDLADDSEKEIASSEARELLLQYKIEPVAACNVSNITREGMEALKDTIIEKVLSTSFSDNRFDTTGKPMPCFLPVDRVFSKPGYGVVVTGTLISGEINVGDNIKIAPDGLDGRVRGLETFNHKIEKAYPGQRLAVNIATKVSKESKVLERGHCVVGTESGKDPVKVRTMVVQIDDLGGIETKIETNKDRKYRKLKPQPIRFYHGTAERSGSLRWLTEVELADGSATYIGQIYLKEPVLAYPGQNYVLRYGDYGIAGGVVLLTARPRWLSREGLLSVGKSLLNREYQTAILDYARQKPGLALSRRELGTLVGMKEIEEKLAEIIESKQAVLLNNLLIAGESLDHLSLKVREFLEASEEPVPYETLRVELAPLMERVVFQHLVNHQVESGLVIKVEDRLSLPGNQKNKESFPELNKNQKLVMDVLEGEFVLELSEIASRAALSEADLKKVLESLEKAGQAFLVNYEFAASKGAIDKAHKVLVQIWNQKRNISPGDFRQEVGTSRKYAMALLAHFDDSKVTRRLPSGRVLLKGPS
ncbi:MAG: SelB C-terminal domain-containing protein [Cyanobacteriota/Melainabacteria group bacterium]